MRSKRANPRKRRPQSFSLEALEPRLVMAGCVELGELANLAGHELLHTHDRLADYWSNTALPLIGNQLQDTHGPIEALHDQLPQIVEDLQDELDGLDPDDTDTFETEVESFLE